MRTILLLSTALITGCATQPTKYTGIVRRHSDGRPVAGIPVAATARPAPHVLFMFPRSDIRAGVTRSNADGTFSFVLSHPPRRLSFTALGARRQRLVKPFTYEVTFGDVTVHHPSPHMPTIITIPDDFKPSSKL